MRLQFYKYQGTGNDFVIIDNRQLLFPKNDTKLVAHLCDRRFGVGADGLMLLENATTPTEDFVMIYYNADGNKSTMCGNGGRCLVAFAKQLGIIESTAIFSAIDGRHTAHISNDELVHLQMQDVKVVEKLQTYTFTDTGSPHHVTKVQNLKQFNVKENGRTIRNGAPYYEEGANVNFVEKIADNQYAVRTYERGVEDETFSCGTGVTAVALSMHALGELTENSVLTKTPGGTLQVTFEPAESGYKNIFLIGPAQLVFEGTIVC